jgi:hypothetical protein
MSTDPPARMVGDEGLCIFCTWASARRAFEASECKIRNYRSLALEDQGAALTTVGGTKTGKALAEEGEFPTLAYEVETTAGDTTVCMTALQLPAALLYLAANHGDMAKKTR